MWHPEGKYLKTRGNSRELRPGKEFKDEQWEVELDKTESDEKRNERKEKYVKIKN